RQLERVEVDGRIVDRDRCELRRLILTVGLAADDLGLQADPPVEHGPGGGGDADSETVGEAAFPEAVVREGRSGREHPHLEGRRSNLVARVPSTSEKLTRERGRSTYRRDGE